MVIPDLYLEHHNLYLEHHTLALLVRTVWPNHDGGGGGVNTCDMMMT